MEARPRIEAARLDPVVLFAGRRWKVIAVDEKARVIEVQPHKGGQVPRFDTPSMEDVHTRLVAEMKEVYESEDLPNFLDGKAHELLAEGRGTFRRAGLNKIRILEMGGRTLLFPWVGTAAVSVLCVALSSLGLKCEDNGIGVTAMADRDETVGVLKKLASFSDENLSTVENAATGLGGAKYDEFTPPELLKRFWCRRWETVHRELPTIVSSLTAF
jgi:ATP-dependent Lhr-like helicase